MTDAFEDLLRSTLSDMAEEAPTMQDPLSRAERRARARRLTTVAVGAAGVVAALAIGAPFAFAADGNETPARPANSAPSAVPSPHDPSAVPSPRDPSAVPSPHGPSAVPSPTGL